MALYTFLYKCPKFGGGGGKLHPPPPLDETLVGIMRQLVLSRVYNRKREGEYPTPYTAVQTHCG